MKVDVTTQDYIAYRDRHNGCMDLKEIKFELYNKDNTLLAEGALLPREEDREQVKSGMCSSVVLACLDANHGQIAIEELAGDASATEMGLTEVPDDLTAAAFTLRAKTIVWQVGAIDEDLNIVYVRGMV